MSEALPAKRPGPPDNCALCRLGTLTVPCEADDVRRVGFGSVLGEPDHWFKPHRNGVVQGEGPVPCPIMLIGEAPGFQEDRDLRPFVEKAPAGRVLARAMDEVGLCRIQYGHFHDLSTGLPDNGCPAVYITNALKCRPLDNKIDRFPDALEICRSTYLAEEIEAVNPRVIVCLGRVAALPWFGKQSALAVRALEDGRMVIHAPHPSNIARGNADNRPKLVEALKIAKKVGYG